MSDENKTAEEYRDEFYTESLSEVLVKSIGYYVECEFLIGTSGLVQKNGIVYAAGINFITLYDDSDESYTSCDLYSLKFVKVFNRKTIPRNTRNNYYNRTNKK